MCSSCNHSRWHDFFSPFPHRLCFNRECFFSGLEVGQYFSQRTERKIYAEHEVTIINMVILDPSCQQTRRQSMFCLTSKDNSLCYNCAELPFCNVDVKSTAHSSRDTLEQCWWFHAGGNGLEDRLTTSGQQEQGLWFWWSHQLSKGAAGLITASGKL